MNRARAQRLFDRLKAERLETWRRLALKTVATGQRNGKRLTPEQKAFIRKHPEMSHRWLSELFGFTYEAICTFRNSKR